MKQSVGSDGSASGRGYLIASVIACCLFVSWRVEAKLTLSETLHAWCPGFMIKLGWD